MSYDANECVRSSEKREISWQVRKECSRQRERERDRDRHNEKIEMSETKGMTRMLERKMDGWMERDMCLA